MLTNYIPQCIYSRKDIDLHKKFTRVWKINNTQWRKQPKMIFGAAKASKVFPPATLSKWSATCTFPYIFPNIPLILQRYPSCSTTRRITMRKKRKERNSDSSPRNPCHCAQCARAVCGNGRSADDRSSFAGSYNNCAVPGGLGNNPSHKELRGRKHCICRR